ncbi:MAG: pilus assembly protein [Peptococcaceae bacterium]|nr:pilus assembly protein [Peptococcaceae bacterium]
MRIIRKLILDRRGQALVELALVLPLLLVLAIGTMEFGRIFHSYLVITNATREGARVGVLGENTADSVIKNRVKEAGASLGLSDSQITVTPAQNSRTRGVPLTVKIDYSVNLITPVLGAVLPNPFPLTASTTMRIE